MAERIERLLAALEAEIGKLSKLEHELARTKRLLQEQATRLRLGADPELVMAVIHLSAPHETTLALLERVDPVLSEKDHGAATPPEGATKAQDAASDPKERPTEGTKREDRS